jgi:hypothetical protein
MAKLIWDEVGKRLYETGVSNGVLYVRNVDGTYPSGVMWNGLTALNESPSGAEASPFYADNIVYANIMSTERYGGTIEAYTYPDEWGQCDGSAELATGVLIGQQGRSTFGLVYKTVVGNDVTFGDYGYKSHIVYGAMATPSEKSYSSVNESPELVTFSWEFTTTPVAVTGKKPTASITIDSTKVDPAKLATLEGILFGTTEANARLPLPDEIASILAEEAPSALALSTIVPADDGVDIAITSNVTITFNNKIAHESIIIASAAGELVAGEKTWDATGKILTFNPTSNLTLNTVYIVTIGGVVDIYGQALTPVVKNFLTVAA